jgi:hypothetical protein
MGWIIAVFAVPFILTVIIVVAYSQGYVRGERDAIRKMVDQGKE